MKKLLFTTFVLFCTFIAKAQLQYGVQVAGVLSTATFTDDDIDSIDKKFKPGFSAGIFAELSIDQNFSLKPSLNYMQKGVEVSGKTTEEGILFEQNLKASLNYLELPVLAIYKIGGEQGKLFIGIGPSIGYGISGKLKGKVEAEDEGITYSESFSIDAFKSEDDNGAGFKKWDFGLTGVAGYNINQQIAVQASYVHGLSNIANDADGDNKFSNRNILLSLSYKL